ncbi:unnamed protein product [Fusarium graminearum]|nr:unnamed protein product [Fusarium graminearum]
MYSSCVMVTCTSSFGMFLHQEKQANYPDDVPYSMGMSSCCGLMTRSSVCSNRYISTWTGVQEEKKAILALRLASEPPRFRVVVGSCLVIVANFFRGFGPDLSNIVMAVHDCFFHLVEWIEYDETEPKWEVIWKVKSVCSGAMIDFADDNKQTCVSQLEGEGCIVWREVLSSFYDIFTYCEWPDLSGLSNPPSCAVSSHSPSNRYHYDNQAAELLTALQHVERSEPERAQTIAVIEQLVRLIALTIYLLSLLYTTSATRCRTSYIKIRYVQWVPSTILYLFFLGPFSKSTTSGSHRISRVECVLATIPPKDPSEPCLFLADLLSQYCSLADFPVISSTTRSDVSFCGCVDEVSLRPPNNMDDDGRTKKVGATSNKRLRDEDDSEDGDNSKEQNQQLSKRPRTDDETVEEKNGYISAL